MEPKELQDATKKVPFLLELVDGRVYFIDTPDTWFITPVGRMIAIFKGGRVHQGDFFIDEPADKIKRVYQPSPSVTMDRFVTALNRQPFRPFTLVLASGAKFMIDAPEHASINRSGCIIRFHGPDNIDHVIEAAHVTGFVGE